MYSLDYLGDNSFTINNGLEDRRNLACNLSKDVFKQPLHNINRKIEHQYPRGYYRMWRRCNKEGFLDYFK